MSYNSQAMTKAGDVLRRMPDLIDLDEENAFTQYLKREGGLKLVG